MNNSANANKTGESPRFRSESNRAKANTEKEPKVQARGLRKNGFQLMTELQEDGEGSEYSGYAIDM